MDLYWQAPEREAYPRGKTPRRTPRIRSESHIAQTVGSTDPPGTQFPGVDHPAISMRSPESAAGARCERGARVLVDGSSGTERAHSDMAYGFLWTFAFDPPRRLCNQRPAGAGAADIRLLLRGRRRRRIRQLGNGVDASALPRAYGFGGWPPAPRWGRVRSTACGARRRLVVRDLVDNRVGRR